MGFFASKPKNFKTCYQCYFSVQVSLWEVEAREWCALNQQYMEEVRKEFEFHKITNLNKIKSILDFERRAGFWN